MNPCVSGAQQRNVLYIDCTMHYIEIGLGPYIENTSNSLALQVFNVEDTPNLWL